MSTAVQPTLPPPAGTASTHAALVISSLVGGLIVLAGLVIAGYVVPMLWQEFVAPATSQLPGFLNVFLKVTFQLAAAGALVYAATHIAGSNPPKGLRGGIILVIAAFIAIFFIVRAVSINTAESGYGTPITAVVLALLLFGGYKLLMSMWAEGKMHTIEEQGWMHTNGFKATQGLTVRRWTLIGILIIGWTGAYSLSEHRSMGVGDLLISVPFVANPIAILPSKEYTVPILIALFTGWFAWRLVNVPVFADFLIATEAEMNKVSWSTRKRLIQDTIVVLITVAIITAFLLIVDLFWGWLLSRSFIGVLPSKPPEVQKKTAGEAPKW
jgi:preprotein translocase SecE subunit